MSDTSSPSAGLAARIADLRAASAWGELRALLEREAREDVALGLVLAEAELRTGALAAARDRLAALVPALAFGDGATYRRAVNMLGAAHFELGQLAEAEAVFGEALSLANGAGDALTLARATNNLGMIANVRGQRTEALTRYRLAIPAYQRVGNPRGLAETNHNLAITFRDLGDLDTADRHERRAIEYAREAGDERLLAMCQVGRADLALRRGEARVAAAGAQVGATSYARLPDRLGEADALRLVGVARTALGEHALARTALDRAVELAEAGESLLIVAEAYEARARLAVDLGDLPAARREAALALARLRELGAVDDVVRVEAWVATLG